MADTEQHELHIGKANICHFSLPIFIGDRRKQIMLALLLLLGITWAIYSVYHAMTAPPCIPATETIINPRDGATMILIPAGAFLMGTNGLFANSDEKPLHTVVLDAYYIDCAEETGAAQSQTITATPRATSREPGLMMAGSDMYSARRANEYSTSSSQVCKY